MYRAEVYGTHNCCPSGNIDLDKILTSIPCKIRGEKSSIRINSSQTTIFFIVIINDNFVCATLLHPNTIICEAVHWMEIKYPEQPSTFENDDFITLMLQT